MKLQLTVHPSWSDYTIKQRQKYLRTFLKKGEMRAALTLVSGSARKLKRYGTESDFLHLLTEVQNIDSTTPIVPYYKKYTPLPVKYYFPGEKMENATVAQFALADRYYMWLAKAIDNENADKIIECTTALLCILARRPEDPVISYQQIKREIPLMRKRYLKYATVAIEYFTPCKYFIYETYGPLIFSSGGSDRPNDLGWDGTVMGVAESGIMGTMKDVYQVNLYEFLTYLVKKKQDDSELNNPKRKP